MIEDHKYSILTAQTDTNQLKPVMDVLEVLFTHVVLIPIAVVTSGWLLSLGFDLGEDDKNYLRIPLPPVLDIRIKGPCVFLAFALLLVIVPFELSFLSKHAVILFCKKAPVTNNPWHANLILSAILAIIISGFAAFINLKIQSSKNRSELRQLSPPPLSEKERVMRLTGH